MSKHIIFIGLALLCGCVAALLFGEVFVRLVVPQNLETPANIFAPHPEARFCLKPGVDEEFRHIESTSRIRTNSLGLRSKEVQKKQPGEYRILGLGDSFGFGYSVNEDQGMFGRLETLLNDGGYGRKYTVINGAVVGYGVAQEYALCRDLMPKIDPDFLVVVLFVGNDFFDSDPDRLAQITVRDGALVFQQDEDPAGPALIAPFRSVLVWLHEHSHLFRFLRRTLNQYITHWGLTLVEDPDIYMDVYPPGSRYISGTEALFSAMENFVGYAREKSLPISFVIVPTVSQVRSDRWRNFLRHHQPPGIHLVRNMPQDRIKGFLDSLNVPCLDLLPKFQAVDEDSPLYYQVDPHLNARGHDLVAKLLANDVIRVMARDSLQNGGGRR
jgi:hypothetical protein